MRVRIQDLGELYTGNTPSKKNDKYWNSNDIGFVKPDIIPDTHIEIIRETNEFISNEAKEKARIVDKGSIFITCIGSIGKIGIASKELAFNQQINAIVPNSKVITKYLAYAFLANKKRLQAMANAPVVPIINKSQFGDFEIHINEDKNIQKSIVEKLDKLSSLIDSQKYELELLDELVKARFIELFGDMKPTTKLSRYIVELRAGKSLAGTEVCKNKVLKTGAATFGFFDKNQFKYYPVDYIPNPLHKVETGDVIVSRMNTPELVGSCSYVFEAPEDTYYPDRLWKTIVTDDCNPIFLWQLLWQQDIRKQIKENSFGTSGTMNNISKVKFLNIDCIDAPFGQQNEFASFVQQIDKSKQVVQAKINAYQELFEKMMQKYFG